ncbi:hypothetical protein KPH14_007041 [Odynerus spinipes]|uniref:Uncharacterized protein n=1 Tax=Odynerus spinipes TaxID=1348599 RepID=A0AAD9RRP8_9HYME|nr:hypothetical protein KPH14_007041 [Odynerus spinipes]
MTKSKRQNSLSKHVENFDNKIGSHWYQRTTISDLVYNYLSKIADNYTKVQQNKSACNQFRRRNRRRKKLS